MPEELNVVNRLFDIVYPFAPRLPDPRSEAITAGLRNAGLTSLAAVRLMLEVESAFDLTIPDKDLTPENFNSIESIARLIQCLRER